MSKIDDYTPKNDNAPKWASGFALILGAVVGAILASTPLIESFMGKNRDHDKIVSLEGQVKNNNDNLNNLYQMIGEQGSRINILEDERNSLKTEVELLKGKIETRDGRIEELIRELDDKEARIKELETLIAKLTDGNPNSFR